MLWNQHISKDFGTGYFLSIATMFMFALKIDFFMSMKIKVAGFDPFVFINMYQVNNVCIALKHTVAFPTVRLSYTKQIHIFRNMQEISCPFFSFSGKI